MKVAEGVPGCVLQLSQCRKTYEDSRQMRINDAVLQALTGSTVMAVTYQALGAPWSRLERTRR